MRLSQDGLLDEHVLQSGQYFDDPQRSDDNWFAPQLSQLVPDGIGGVLSLGMLAFSGSRVFRLGDQGNMTDDPWSYGRIELVGQDGTVYANDVDTNAPSVGKNAVDIRTRQTKWTLPPDLSWLAASPNSGATVQNASLQVQRFDGSGQELEQHGTSLLELAAKLPSASAVALSARLRRRHVLIHQAAPLAISGPEQ